MIEQVFDLFRPGRPPSDFPMAVPASAPVVAGTALFTRGMHDPGARPTTFCTIGGSRALRRLDLDIRLAELEPSCPRPTR